MHMIATHRADFVFELAHTDRAFVRIVLVSRDASA
jgi:hypothetical protein